MYTANERGTFDNDQWTKNTAWIFMAGDAMNQNTTIIQNLLLIYIFLFFKKTNCILHIPNLLYSQNTEENIMKPK